MEQHRGRLEALQEVRPDDLNDLEVAPNNLDDPVALSPDILEVAPNDLEVAPNDLEVAPNDLEVAPDDLEVACHPSGQPNWISQRTNRRSHWTNWRSPPMIWVLGSSWLR